MNADRDAWTTYVQRQGLLRDAGILPKANKYHAEPVVVDGRRFASKKEAARFRELQAQQHAGLIDLLKCQPVFPLLVQGQHIGRYTADFQYRHRHTGDIVVEDVKSRATKTEAYRLRKKLAEAIHGITVTEV